MTDNVVTLKPPKEECLWQCACGCATHFLLDSGEIQCPSCGKRAPGLWRPAGEVIDSAEAPESFDIHRMGEPKDFVIERFKQKLHDEGLLAAVAFYASGRISTSIMQDARPDTDARRKWWRRQANKFLKDLFL